MGLCLERDADSRGRLISWWPGDRLAPDTEVVCNPDEVVLFIDGDEVVATLGPGRHRLVPTPAGLERYLHSSFLSRAARVAVAFVTTASVRLEAAGVLEDLDGEEVSEPQVYLRAAVRVVDAPRLLPLLEKLSDGESLEDWLRDELLLHAQAAASESNLTPAELGSGEHGGQLASRTSENANELLEAYGIGVEGVEFALRAEPA